MVEDVHVFIPLEPVEGKESFTILNHKNEIIEGMQNMSNIVLHDVTIIQGILVGTYRKCETVVFYNKYIDKSKYPTYVDFVFNAIEHGSLTENDPFKGMNSDTLHLYDMGDMNPDYESFLSDEIEIEDSISLKCKGAFLCSRIGFGNDFPSITMVEYN